MLRKQVGPRGTSWQLIVRVVDPTTGQRRQLSRTVRLAKRGEAERALRAFVTEVEDGAVRTERRTVAELLDAWHAHKAGRGRSITTLREYRRLGPQGRRQAPRVQWCRRHGPASRSNVAEYSGLLAGSRAALAQGAEVLRIRGDSSS